jgi:dihydrodipicolinate synthase/N-acetylneuraminate lyase
MKLKQHIYASGDNPAPLVKAAMEALGRPGTRLRSPHLPLDDGVREGITKALQEFRDDIG